MNAFISAVVAAILIAVVAAMTLNLLGSSTADMQQSPRGSVRL